jgi:hypothetical protein
VELAEGGVFACKALIRRTSLYKNTPIQHCLPRDEGEKHGQLAIGSDNVSEACTFR